MTIEELAAKAKAQLPPKKAEPKGAAPAPSAEIKKTEEETKKETVVSGNDEKSTQKVDKAKIEDAELKAKKDEEILSKADNDLNNDEKVRKTELLKVKQDTEDKEKKSNVQKRFDELTAKIKDLEATTATTKAEKEAEKAEKEAIQSELNAIKKQLNMTPDDKVAEEVKTELSALRKKYLEEDRSLPREEKREMAKEEFDEWLLEDYESASEWLTRRSIRRYQDENNLKVKKLSDRKASEILEKQDKSAERSFVKHPELNVSSREQELAKAGKSKQEILQTILSENPKYKMCYEILKESPQKYLTVENGPELIVAEMEKRIASNPDAIKPDTEKEDLKRQLAEMKAELDRVKNLDPGITSTRGAEPAKTSTEVEKLQEKLAKKVGLDPERLKKRVAERVKQGYDS